MKRIAVTCLLVFLLFTTACTVSTPTTINPKVLSTPTQPSQPDSGMATVVGQVLHEQG
jgi:hypothetical protein